MRRRTWAFIRMMDVFFSHQLSLPSMISENDCDTELPHNIYDEEFGPDTKVLPPSRPQTEPTPISYMVAKVQLCNLLGVILQATGRLQNQAHYDDILRFDAKLRDLKAVLPPHLQLRPLDGSHVPLTLVMARYHLDILYLKVMCVLHRKYIPRARHNSRYAHSRRTAIEASLEMLQHLATLHRESQPNGLMHTAKWFFASVATKDFLLPAMVVVLDLHFDNGIHGPATQQDMQSLFFWTREQRQTMIDTLELTRDIWKGLADTSIEAFKASNVLDVMLQKIKSLGGADGPRSSAEVPVGPGSHGGGGPRGPTNLTQEQHPGGVSAKGMLPGDPIPPSSMAYNGPRSSMGTAYGIPGLPLGAANSGVSPDSISGTTLGLGTPSTFEYSGPMLGLENIQSPLSMFDSMANSNLDFSGNFDWVSISPGTIFNSSFGPVHFPVLIFRYVGFI